MMQCPQCGTPMNEDSKFCPQCGCALQTQSTQPETHTEYTEMPSEQPAKTIFGLPKRIVLLAIPIVIAILLGITCPGKQAHVDAIHDEIMAYFNKKAEGDNEAKIYAALGASIVDKVLKAKLKVHNYVLFSTGELENNGNGKTISFGILGKVFTFGVDEDAINNMDGKGKKTTEDADN